jgi:hypothetical protein
VAKLMRMRFKRFERFGVLSNWGSYSAAESKLLVQEEALTKAIDTLEPWMATHKATIAARAELQRVRGISLAETEYKGTAEALGDALDRLSSAQNFGWKQRLEELRDFLANQQRDASKFDAAGVRRTLETKYQEYFGGPATAPQRRVDEFRALIDHLPDYYGEHVINLAHAALNRWDRQVGRPGQGHLGPSARGEHVINRGISDVVVIEGEAWAPVFIAVYGTAVDKSRAKHKDVGQNPDTGQVLIHTGSGDTSDDVFWVSIGRPLRQLKWLAKYQTQGAPEPLIRSFLIPVEVADRISKGAITEYKSKGAGADLNVDKHFERNQFGIVAPESIELLRKYALPGSLRTFTDKQLTGAPPANWGETRPTSELRERLGVPKPIPGFPIFADPAKKEFTSKSKYPKQIADLTRLYAYHTGNAQYLPEGNGGTEKMPGDAERTNAVQKFFLLHRPPELSPAGATAEAEAALRERFVTEYIAPWATQAQIAQTIVEDYDDLTGPEKETLPEEPEKIVFTEGALGRGQRRSGALAKAREQQELMTWRDEFKAALLTAEPKAHPIFKVAGGVPPALNTVLLELQQLAPRIKVDYGFGIGNMVSIRKRIEEDRPRVLRWLGVLNNHQAVQGVTELAAALKPAAAARVPK